MGLQQYRDKRDFKLTREPRGKVAKRKALAGDANTLAFYIQRHDARRLHYDFRLELDGTLKSWAVPKGPSLDPADKRLAVEVEDHPLEYGQFEGDIPRGQYGAGHVMLWDQGTWEAIGDPMQGYRQGALKFYLHGQKLHGKWTLVRMKTRDEDKQHNWLLIKEQDEQALKGQAAQITETAPESVKAASKQTAQPATAKTPAAKRQASNTASIGHLDADLDADLASLAPLSDDSLPARLEPQLATLVTQAPDGDEWLSEIKYDGYRALSRLEHGKVTMLSRNGLDWSGKWPALVSALEGLPVKQAWLDGEVVAFDEAGNISFQALQNAMRLGNDAQLGYFIFDLLYLDGHDLAPLPLQQRKALLQVLLSSLSQTQGQSGPLFFSVSRPK